MNRRKLMEFGIVVLLLTSAGSLQAFAQVNERTIIITDDRRSPVKIMSVRTKGKTVGRKLFEGFDIEIALGTVNGEIQENTTYARVVARKLNG